MNNIVLYYEDEILGKDLGPYQRDQHTPKAHTINEGHMLYNNLLKELY